MRRALPALVVGLLLLGAGPAAASSTTAPERVGEHGEVVLGGQLDEPATERVTGVAELRLAGPGSEPLAVARSARPTPQDPRRDPSQVSFPLTTAPCNLPVEACAAGGVLPNGTWTLQLFEVDRAAGEDDVERGTPATFVVDVPAFPPQDVAASLAGRTVTVTWARGVGPGKGLVEPDVSWSVDDGAGRTVAVGTEACADGVCTATLAYPDDVSGPRTVTVAAARPGSTPPTATAAPEPVVVPAVPGAAGPSGSPSGAPGEGGAGQATAQSFAQGFNSFAPSLGLPKLPPLPEPSAVAVPQVADTFDPTLGFEDRTEVERVPPPQAAPPGRESVLRSTGGLLDESAVRGLAGALVLGLAGAHLRAWLSGTRPTDL